MDHIVVDVEIAKEVGHCSKGWDSTEEMGVAVACVWEYKTARMRVYGPEEIGQLRERLLAADRVSGFNIYRFDYPVIWGFSKADWNQLHAGDVVPKTKKKVTGDDPYLPSLLRKTNDLLRRIWQAQDLDPDVFDKRTHGGVGLDAVAYATLGVRKIGNGADAPDWYRRGLIQKVANYCCDDVAIERDLTDFVDRYGYVIDPRDGQRLKLELWTEGR